MVDALLGTTEALIYSAKRLELKITPDRAFGCVSGIIVEGVLTRARSKR